MNPVSLACIRGSGVLLFGEAQNIHPCTHVRCALWYGVNYLDTSALIKRFAVEKGSPLVRNLLRQPQPIAVWTLECTTHRWLANGLQDFKGKKSLQRHPLAGIQNL